MTTANPTRVGLPSRPKTLTELAEEKKKAAAARAAENPTAVIPTTPSSTPANTPASSTTSQAKLPAKKQAPFVVPADTTGPSSKEFLMKLLNDCGARKASDLHVHPDRGMWYLVDGNLTKEDTPESIVDEDTIIKWMEYADGYHEMGLDKPERLLEGKGHTTVAFDTGTWRVRGSFRKSTAGVSCTFRMIPSKIPTVKEFDVPQIIQDISRRPSGLILIEGPTGSGKTTSIAALINLLNETTDQHFYCIEDPIEFHHKPLGASVFTMREIGVHAQDYDSAVENALRSKPNIIFVGEMLTNETKKAALHASSTGHLVITTAHAGSVTEAVDSFIGSFKADEQPQIRSRLAESLLAVMCQSLVPTKDGKLTAAREVMVSNLNFKESIREGTMQTLHPSMSSDPQSFTLEDDLQRLVAEGKIDVEMALDRAKKPEILRIELTRKGLIRNA